MSELNFSALQTSWDEENFFPNEMSLLDLDTLNSLHEAPWEMAHLSHTNSSYGSSMERMVGFSPSMEPHNDLPDNIGLDALLNLVTPKQELDVEIPTSLPFPCQNTVEASAPKQDIVQLALKTLNRSLPTVEDTKRKNTKNSEKVDSPSRKRSKVDPQPMAAIKHESSSLGQRRMEPFHPSKVTDWKHVLYNLLVENYNSADKNTLIYPVEITLEGRLRYGFTINSSLQPKRVLAELYATHVRKESLQSQDQNSPFIQDLYKYYLRSAYQLMSKYFKKVGLWTYIYEDIPLFVPGEDIAAAAERVKMLDTKQRRKKKRACDGN